MLIAVLDSGRDVEWHVGEKLAALPEDVKFVQADCDELEWLTREFNNLPYSGARVQRWYGDVAKMIVWRLRS